jgi:LacI family transcriptional regulator
MSERATLKDVAALAGVHVSTASRALNPSTRGLITPEVVAKVMEVSRRLNYQPNAAAHSLRTRRTRTVGVVVPDITNPVFPPIIRGIEDGLAARGYLAIVANSDGRINREADVVGMLRTRGVDGMILASVEREDRAVSELAASGMPIVTVNRRLDESGVSSVVNDEADGMRQVLDHLAGLGHRAVANIAGPQALSTGEGRYRAFEQHRRALGLDQDPALVVFAGAFNEQEGEAGIRALLATSKRFTAVVCSNDRLAIGAIAALVQSGLDVPTDTSVTGYNDMPLVDRLSPALSTVRVHQYEAGIDATRLLFELMETAGPDRIPRHLVRPVDLVIRSSTARPAT